MSTSVALDQHLAGQRVELDDALDLVAEELDAQRRSPRRPGRSPACRRARGTCRGRSPCRCARTGCRPAGAGPCRACGSRPCFRVDHDVAVLLGAAQAVDAGDRGHDDHVAPGEEGLGGGVAQPVDLLVDAGVLLDVGVGAGDVGLGLVVVVVGDEVLDGVVAGRTP